MTWFITWSSHQNSVFKAVRKPISPSFNSWALKILAKVTRVTRLTDDHLQGAHPPNDHLQEARSYGRSFANGRSLQMINCKRPDPPDDQLQEASLSWWSFARGRFFLMIICKRPVYPDDHLQEASPSRWSFARGRSIRMIIWKRPVHPDDHLQEAGPTGWSFARGWSIIALCVFPCQ